MQRNLHVLTRNKLLSIYYFIFFKPGSNNLRFNTIDIAFSVFFYYLCKRNTHDIEVKFQQDDVPTHMSESKY